MNVIRALEMLRKVEQKMGLLYALYYREFSKDPEAAAVFREMSLDEKTHASTIEYQIRMARRNPELFGDVDFDCRGVDAMIEKIDEARARHGESSIEDALALGMELENNAFELSCGTLIVESFPAIEPLMKTLGTADRCHSETLRRLAEKVADRQATAH